MKAVSLFAGVGAFELAMKERGIQTVLSCEIDKYACQVLKKHFPETEVFNDDVRKLRGRDIITRHGGIDILTAGFPCQSFSIAGKREGFRDTTRGTLFFEVARLVDELKPSYVFLENVRGLVSHEGGKTLGIIYKTLGELNYDAFGQILNSRYFGVPQNRERIYIVGHLRRERTRQIFPIRKNGGLSKKTGNTKGAQSQADHIAGTIKTKPMRADGTFIKVHITQPRSGDPTKGGTGPLTRDDGNTYCLDTGNTQAVEVGTWRTYKEDKGFKKSKSGLAPTIAARAREDGSGQGVIKDGARIRRLTPIECERLQSFPDNWTNVNNMSDTQRYKQMGNSITVNVLREMFYRIT